MLVKNHRRVEGLGEFHVLADARVEALDALARASRHLSYQFRAAAVRFVLESWNVFPRFKKREGAGDGRFAPV